MRCKNCGFENDDERYICQNCGAPLYDEEDEITGEEELDDQNDGGDNDGEDKNSTKKSVIIIVVLAVVLVAMITGLIIAVAGGSGGEKPESKPSESQSEEKSSSVPPSSSTTKKPKTSAPTTSKPSTEPSSEPETESTTVAKFMIAVDIDGDGTVTGDGIYEQGKKATLTAMPAAGAQFVGWYDNESGELVASGNKYTITVLKNQSLTAKFKPLVQEIPSDGEDTEAETVA